MLHKNFMVIRSLLGLHDDFKDSIILALPPESIIIGSIGK